MAIYAVTTVMITSLLCGALTNRGMMLRLQMTLAAKRRGCYLQGTWVRHRYIPSRNVRTIKYRRAFDNSCWQVAVTIAKRFCIHAVRRL